MRASISRGVLPLFLLLFITSWPSSLGAATVNLTAPDRAVCVTDEDAVFTVVKGELRPVRGEFSIAPPGVQPLRLSVQMAPGAQPGHVARLYVLSTETLDSVSAQVGVNGRTPVSRAVGFIADSHDGTELWAVLLGMPADGAAREYTVRLTAKAGKRSFLTLRLFTVPTRAFAAETIALTGEMSRLMTTVDPQKREEALALARLLATPHADAVYETGLLADPLAGARRTAGYGDRREYLYPDKSTSLSIHEGVDIASPEGTTVPACGRGRVVFAGPRIITGNTVIIEHLPGLFSLYDHLSVIAVQAGGIVEKGETVGAVGMTGFATGPHLHWETRVSETAVDPDSLCGEPLLDKIPDISVTSSSDEGR